MYFILKLSICDFLEPTAVFKNTFSDWCFFQMNQVFISYANFGLKVGLDLRLPHPKFLALDKSS